MIMFGTMSIFIKKKKSSPDLPHKKSGRELVFSTCSVDILRHIFFVNELFVYVPSIS